MHSGEPENGSGDGDMGEDIHDAAIGSEDRGLSLRAERSDTGNGVPAR